MTIPYITPNYGPITGGTPITITGSDFTSISNLSLDNSFCTDVIVVNSNTITAITTEHSEGLVALFYIKELDMAFYYPNLFTYINTATTTTEPTTTTTTTTAPTTTTTTTTTSPLERQKLNAFAKFFYSGGLNNADPKKSLGGESSNVTVNVGKNNIFNSVEGTFYSEGLTDYRCIFLKNTSSNKIYYLYLSLDDFFLGSVIDLGFNFVNEIQSITILNGPFTNGQEIVFSYDEKPFTVIYSTNFSTWLYNFNYSITKVEGLENVTVSGSSNNFNSVFEITFNGSAGYKSHPLLVLVGYTLTPLPSISIVKNVEGSPINIVPSKILTADREPTSITFYDASISSPVYLPLLNPGDFLAIWLRRIIYPNTIAVENDGCNLIINGNYEVVEK